jgi:hypothetical protein
MKNKHFVTVKVTADTGVSWVTPIRGTIEDARKYFLGNRFNHSLNEDDLVTVVKVEEVKA